MSTINSGHFSDDGQPSVNIGWKMMQKMGYVSGAGLGKYEHGRLEPVIPKQAPKKVSLDNFTKLSNEFEKRKENQQNSLNKKRAKHSIFKIIHFLRKNHVIGEISRKNRLKLTSIFEENPPNLHNPDKSIMKSMEIPGLISRLDVNYVDNLINYLINMKFIGKIGEKSRRKFQKLIESEENRRQNIKSSESPIFVPQYESDCEILLDKSILPTVEPEIVIIKDDDDLIIDQNKWTSDNFQEIDYISTNSDHSEKSIIDLPCSSSSDDHEIPIIMEKMSKINILIRNFNLDTNQFEEIKLDQFSAFRNFLDESLAKSIAADNLPIPKIDRLAMISKFCCLIVCSEKSTIDWLSKTIDKGAEILIDRNFRPKMSIVDDNDEEGHPVALLIPDCARIGSKLAIKYLNRQNLDLRIDDFWRLIGELSIDDDFSSLFFVIDRNRSFSKLKNRHFRLHYRLGEILAVGNLSFDDVI